jgi:hypothetical protein
VIIAMQQLKLKNNSTFKRKTSVTPVSFEPTILASERVQTYALDSMATGIGFTFIWLQILDFNRWSGVKNYVLKLVLLSVIYNFVYQV